MSPIGSVYNMGRVAQLTSPHQDTHTQIRHTKTLHRNNFRNPCNLPQKCVLLQTHYLFFETDFTKLTQTFVLSHSMPHIDLCLDFPKLSLFAPLLTTCLPCLHNSMFCYTLPQSLDLLSMPSFSFLPPWSCTLVLLYGLQMSLLKIVTSFGCVMPLCKPMHPNEPTCPFTNRCTHESVHSSTLCVPWDRCVPTSLVRPCLVCFFEMIDVVLYGCVDGVI